MNHFFQRLSRKQGVKVALYLVITLILIDTFLTYRYKSVMNQNVAVQNKLNEIAARKERSYPISITSI
jgi:hypothetical protein